MAVEPGGLKDQLVTAAADGELKFIDFRVLGEGNTAGSGGGSAFAMQLPAGSGSGTSGKGYLYLLLLQLLTCTDWIVPALYILLQVIWPACLASRLRCSCSRQQCESDACRHTGRLEDCECLLQQQEPQRAGGACQRPAAGHRHRLAGQPIQKPQSCLVACIQKRVWDITESRHSAIASLQQPLVLSVHGVPVLWVAHRMR